MIIIVNISPPGLPKDGLHYYEVRINRKVIGRFTHPLEIDDAAQCLRDAADAVDAEAMTLRQQIDHLYRITEAK